MHAFDHGAISLAPDLALSHTQIVRLTHQALFPTEPVPLDLTSLQSMVGVLQ